MAYQYSCSACDFQVRSEDQDEVVELVTNHAKDVHDMTMAEDDIMDGMKEVRV